MDGISEWRNFRITDMLKTVYPLKTPFSHGVAHKLADKHHLCEKKLDLLLLTRLAKTALDFEL